tara:strand:- start:471 stop:803 length:333 start_codon:yes stop_codon:yes gene_type:complete
MPCCTNSDREGQFQLEISSDKAISFENVGEKQSDVDDEESDDEELGTSVKVPGSYDESEDNENEDDDAGRGLQSLMGMVSDLAKYIVKVGGEVSSLSTRCGAAEEKLAAM